jgi:hypothetical protein
VKRGQLALLKQAGCWEFFSLLHQQNSSTREAWPEAYVPTPAPGCRRGILFWFEIGNTSCNINRTLMEIRTSDHFYSSLQSFTALTSELIRRGELRHLKACFNLAEKLLNEGEPFVKNAILGNYIGSLHTFVEESSLRTPIINLLPARLRSEFDKQERERKVKSDVFVFTLHLN